MENLGGNREKEEKKKKIIGNMGIEERGERGKKGISLGKR